MLRHVCCLHDRRDGTNSVRIPDDFAIMLNILRDAGTKQIIHTYMMINIGTID